MEYIVFKAAVALGELLSWIWISVLQFFNIFIDLVLLVTWSYLIHQGHFGFSRTEELEMAIVNCKDLILKAIPNSGRQKNLVRRLVQLRLKLQEMKVCSSTAPVKELCC